MGNKRIFEAFPNISQRAREVPWSGIRQMFELAAKVPAVINLSVGQPDFDTPRHIVEAGQQALEAGHTRYASTKGILELREAIARKVWRANGIEIDPETETIVTAGAVEGLLLVFLAILDPGDEVILPNPGYTNYEGIIRLVNGLPVYVPVQEENQFRLESEAVEKLISERTRAIIVNSPANPTGSVLFRSDLEELAGLALRHNLLLISDEAYEAFVYDDLKHFSLASLPDMHDHVASVFTLSKTYAMTGWRIGYVVGPDWLISQMHKMQEDVVSCVATFVQYAAKTALEGPQGCVKRMVDEFDARRKFMVRALIEIEGIRCSEPKGAFYLFPNVSALGYPSTEVAISLLKTSQVVCVPGTAFGPAGEGFLRISYGASMEDLEEGIRRIRHGVEMLRKNAGE